MSSAVGNRRCLPSLLLGDDGSAAGRYVVENLGRGLIAIRASESTVYVGWRLLGTDPSDIAFNVYRASGAARR